MEPLSRHNSVPLISSPSHSRKFMVDPTDHTVETVGDSTKISKKVKYNGKEYIVKVTVKGKLNDAEVKTALQDALNKTKTLAKAFNIGSDESHITSFTLWGNGDLTIKKDTQLLTGEDAKKEALARFKTEKQHYKGKTPAQGEKQAKREEKIKNLKQIKNLITNPPKPKTADDKTGITFEPAVETTVEKMPTTPQTPSKKKKKSPEDPALRELAKEAGPAFFEKMKPIKERALREFTNLGGKKDLSKDEKEKLRVIEEKVLYLDELEAEKELEWFDQMDLPAFRNVISSLSKNKLHVDISEIEKQMKDMCEQIKAGENKAAQRAKIEKLKAFIPTIEAEEPTIATNIQKHLTDILKAYFETK